MILAEHYRESDMNLAETGFYEAVKRSGSASTVSGSSARAHAVNDGSDEDINKDMNIKQTEKLYQATEDLQATTEGVNSKLFYSH